MIVRAPIVNSKSNLKMTQKTLDRAYISNEADTFKIDNALVYQILPKVLQTVTYTEHETGQIVILLINQKIEVKWLDHHLLFLIQCYVNGVLINEVPKFLTPIPSDTMHTIQIENPFDATHPIIIPLKVNGVTSYFELRKLTPEEYKKQNIPKIELMAESTMGPV